MYLLFKNPTKPRARIDDRIGLGPDFVTGTSAPFHFPSSCSRLKAAIGTSCHLFPHLSSSVRRDLAYLRQIISGLCVTYGHGRTHTPTHKYVRMCPFFGWTLERTQHRRKLWQQRWKLVSAGPPPTQLRPVEARIPAAAVGSRRVFSEGTIFLDRICTLIEKILTE